MSITDEDFRAWLENRLSVLTKREKIHSLYRLKEKLRLTHNAVGAVTEMRKDMTISEFKKTRPLLSSKLSSELASFVVDGYLSRDGWNYFIDNIFDPREKAVLVFISDVKHELIATLSPDEIDPFE